MMRKFAGIGCVDEVSLSSCSTAIFAIYSIGAVERMLDIPAATIRNWEERYGLVKPERSDGGHRLYTRAQVEQLRFVKEGLDRGLQPAEAHRLLGEQLARRSGVRSTDAGAGASPADPARRA